MIQRTIVKMYNKDGIVIDFYRGDVKTMRGVLSRMSPGYKQFEDFWQKQWSDVETVKVFATPDNDTETEIYSASKSDFINLLETH